MATEGTKKKDIFDRLDDSIFGPIKSIEGWVIIVTNLHEEATVQDLSDRFSEFGEIQNIELPQNRRTGYITGYCLIAYENKSEAEDAIEEMNGAEFMEQTLVVGFAFVYEEK
eukprot:TRINITY_DN151_c0_g2_i1.p2 TRINITY_DN151_c0_g2~~TRINITY_DN151_c0_g2_i1.p2  ORF type:complete len:112 (-),score=29.37 TRINITY_DN151_c0_g2_i1:29-364(-)